MRSRSRSRLTPHSACLALSMAVAMAVAMTIGSEVIAADHPRDQPPQASQPETSADVEAENPATSAADDSAAKPERWSFGWADVIALGLAVVSLGLIVLTRWRRLDRVPHRPHFLTPLSAFFMFGVIYLLASIGTALGILIFGIHLPDGEGAPPLSFEDSTKLQAAALAARLLGVCAFVSLVRAVPRPQPDRRASAVRAMAIGIAGLLLIWPLMQVAITWAGWLTNAPPDRIAHDTLRVLMERPMDRWSVLMIAMVTMVAPVIEEVMYRGLLQESFRRAGAKPWPAIAIASVVFALAHVNVVEPHALVGLLAFGLALGWAYEKTGRLWAPITMHALFNAGNLLLAQNMNA